MIILNQDNNTWHVPCHVTIPYHVLYQGFDTWLFSF